MPDPKKIARLPAQPEVPVAKTAVAAATEAVNAAPLPARRAKAVRESFKLLETENRALRALKERAQALGQPARKNQLLRAGIRTLSEMSDEAFLACVAGVEPLKARRRTKD